MGQLKILAGKTFIFVFDHNLPHLILYQITDIKTHIQVYKMGSHMVEKSIMVGRELGNSNGRIFADFF